MTATQNANTNPNPIGLKGIAFLEFSANQDFNIGDLFEKFGFSKLFMHKTGNVTGYKQNNIVFLANEGEGFAGQFRASHGPSACGMGMFVEDAKHAFEESVKRGARPFDATEATFAAFNLPAIYGIGDSLIYFVDDPAAFFEAEFQDHPEPKVVADKGFHTIDHLTNNVYKGTLKTWSDFYMDIFGFTQVRYFDIRGEETGLLSYALRSPDGSFCIPINEGTESKSQIEEYLREYKGPGIQHIALATDDLLDSLDKMEGTGVRFLDIDEEYYETVYNRVPNVTEDRERIKKHNVLVDGDEEGYLLQIFTHNAVGPIFFELIQRKNHLAFGEGNFGALFRSIERDQRRRGVL